MSLSKEHFPHARVQKLDEKAYVQAINANEVNFFLGQDNLTDRQRLHGLEEDPLPYIFWDWKKTYLAIIEDDGTIAAATSFWEEDGTMVAGAVAVRPEFRDRKYEHALIYNLLMEAEKQKQGLTIDPFGYRETQEHRIEGEQLVSLYPTIQKERRVSLYPELHALVPNVTIIYGENGTDEPEDRWVWSYEGPYTVSCKANPRFPTGDNDFTITRGRPTPPPAVQPTPSEQ